MTFLAIIVIALAVVALYPVIRDLVRRRHGAAPDYVAGLRALLDGDRAGAVEKLKATVDADQSNIDAYIRLGDLLIESGDIERGVRVHENLALRRNLRPGEERQVFRALARDYIRTDRKLKAVSTLEEVVRADRADRASRELLFGLLLETGSWQQCEEFLGRVEKEHGDRKWVAGLLARYGGARAKDAPDTAREFLDRALRLDPQAAEARVSLGDLHLARGRTDEAVRAWQELLKATPGRNALVRDRLERAFYELGRYDDITATYESLLRRVPDDEGLAVTLALIYQKKGDTDRAVRLLETTCARDGSPLCQAALASLQLDRGDSAAARRTLEELVTRLRRAEPETRG